MINKEIMNREIRIEFGSKNAQLLAQYQNSNNKLAMLLDAKKDYKSMIKKVIEANGKDSRIKFTKKFFGYEQELEKTEYGSVDHFKAVIYATADYIKEFSYKDEKVQEILVNDPNIRNSNIINKYNNNISDYYWSCMPSNSMNLNGKAAAKPLKTCSIL